MKILMQLASKALALDLTEPCEKFHAIRNSNAMLVRRSCSLKDLKVEGRKGEKKRIAVGCYAR